MARNLRCLQAKYYKVIMNTVKFGQLDRRGKSRRVEKVRDVIRAILIIQQSINIMKPVRKQFYKLTRDYQRLLQCAVDLVELEREEKHINKFHVDTIAYVVSLPLQPHRLLQHLHKINHVNDQQHNNVQHHHCC